MLRLPRLKPESEELLHLDFLRFVASVAIVFHHYSDDGVGLMSAFSNRLSLAVDLFFVISGYVIAYVYADRMRSAATAATFIQRRLARLVPLHWLTLLFFIGFTLWGPLFGLDIEDRRKDFGCLVQNAFLVHAWGMCDGLTFSNVSWSISAELGAYLLFPLFLFVMRKSRWVLLFAGGGLALFLYWLGDAGPRNRPWFDWTADFGVLRALPAFIFGMCLTAFKGWLIKIPQARFVLFGLLAIFAICAAAAIPTGALVPLVYLIAAAGAAADLQGRVGKIVRLLAPLGVLTYSIYMLHPLVRIVLTFYVANEVLHLEGWVRNLWVFGLIFPVLIVSYISYHWFETPLRILLSKKPRNRRAEIAADIAP